MANHQQQDAANETLTNTVANLSTDFAPITGYLFTIYERLVPQFMSLSGLLQLGIILVLGIAAFLLSGLLRQLVARLFSPKVGSEVSRVGKLIAELATHILWVIFLWIGTATLKGLAEPNDLLRLAASLLNAWILIRIVSSFVADPFWSRLFATIAWIVAALNVLRLLDPTIALLDSASFAMGDIRVSLYLVIKATGLIIILLWLASTLSRTVQERVSRSKRFTPSVQTLIIQAVRLALMLIAVVVAMNSIGVDLTAFAVFSGAIGVGLGFGLQKIVSNFISGVIILMDRSIKPGDVVEVGETYGWITSLGARFASVRTRDGTEHLIPNEEFIINRVVNWTHSDSAVRRKLPIGVSYDADIELALKLIAEAVSEVPRALKEPKPNILVRSFGDSSVDLEARFWIQDPQNGVSNIASDILRVVWRKFHENGIEIPYPQRDLHIRSGLPDLGAQPNRSM